MRTHLASPRAGRSTIVVAFLLSSSVVTLGIHTSPASAHSDTSAPGAVSPPAPVTPDAAERRYARCIAGAPTTADSFEAWSTRCRERVAAGRM